MGANTIPYDLAAGCIVIGDQESPDAYFDGAPFNVTSVTKTGVGTYDLQLTAGVPLKNCAVLGAPFQCVGTAGVAFNRDNSDPTLVHVLVTDGASNPIDGRFSFALFRTGIGGAPPGALAPWVSPGYQNPFFYTVNYTQVSEDTSTDSDTYSDLISVPITPTTNVNAEMTVGFAIGNDSGATASVALFVDDVQVMAAGGGDSGDYNSGAIVYNIALAAGTHTVAVKWKVAADGGPAITCNPASDGDHQSAALKLILTPN